MGSFLNRGPTTEALIGREVDAHFTDGSVASGFLSTFSFDTRFGIVLENARMIRKGDSKRNVVLGGRLVINSCDLAKVVPKAAQLPSGREALSSVDHSIPRISLQNGNGCVPKKAKNEESKLNPGATLFRPSVGTVTLNSGVHYIANNTPILHAQLEAGGLSPFGAHSHLPVKVIPYGNIPTGNVRPVTYFPQPIVGHLGSRAQPLSVASHYGAPAGPGFVHPGSQSVMVGQPGQVIYVHQPSHEVITPLPSPFLRPFPTPHPTQFLKHQGALMPQLPYCVAAPPLMATVQQPQQAYSMLYNVPILEQQQRSYLMPHNVPILQQQQEAAYLMPQTVQQQPFPSNRYLQHPGTNALLNTKFI